MRCPQSRYARARRLAIALLFAWAMVRSKLAGASTYVVEIPLDSPIYMELDELDALGLLETYIPEVRPISRVEAARLTLEAESMMLSAERPGDALAESILNALRLQLATEVDWLERNAEDNRPSMLVPVERAEAQYVYSRGIQRQMTNGAAELRANEATPLLPNNDDLPTMSGSNEAVRVEGWAGAFSLLTGYAEGAMTGPIAHSPIDVNNQTNDRFRLLRGEVVASIGNAAISFGQTEMSWGTGHFGSLSQGNNAAPFTALRIQSVHPAHLPGFLRYLGPFRVDTFVGKLDHDRTFSYPWIAGQVISFRVVPNFELGFDHVIMFGGYSNNHYNTSGFLGRLTGFNTGNASQGNTNSRGGIFLKLHFPSLRNAEVYQEMLGEDNLSGEVPKIGSALPFLAVSYQGGVFVPRVSDDGLTFARFEYAITEPNYSTHSDSLYWTYNNRLMGYPMGPNASRVDLSLGRWFDYRNSVTFDIFYTERAPRQSPGLTKEHSGGFSLDLAQLPFPVRALDDSLGEIRMRAAFEYVKDINFQPDTNSFRIGLQITVAINPSFQGWTSK